MERKKRILITGAESYIGTAVKRWLGRPDYNGRYQIDTLDMRQESWSQKDFSVYHAILHVAGIAHRRETKKNARLYYEVNRDLAIETARKARNEGVRQFILISSMNVYGMAEGVITKDTIPHPNTNYGKAKLQADTEIQKLENGTFKVAILRPPMVYGKGCKGNYPRLSSFAQKSIVFPNVMNQRSMIYIDNLADFIEKLIGEPRSGIFHPQNLEYVCTSKMVKEIAALHSHRLYLFPVNRFLLLILNLGGTAKKVFGSLVYEKGEDECGALTFYESLRLTEL